MMTTTLGTQRSKEPRFRIQRLKKETEGKKGQKQRAICTCIRLSRDLRLLHIATTVQCPSRSVGIWVLQLGRLQPTRVPCGDFPESGTTRLGFFRARPFFFISKYNTSNASLAPDEITMGSWVPIQCRGHQQHTDLMTDGNIRLQGQAHAPDMLGQHVSTRLRTPPLVRVSWMGTRNRRY